MATIIRTVGPNNAISRIGTAMPNCTQASSAFRKSFTNMFIDEDEYERMKYEETKQLEDKEEVTWKPQKVYAFKLWVEKVTIRQSALDVGVSETTIKMWRAEFKNVLGDRA